MKRLNMPINIIIIYHLMLNFLHKNPKFVYTLFKSSKARDHRMRELTFFLCAP